MLWGRRRAPLAVVDVQQYRSSVRWWSEVRFVVDLKGEGGGGGSEGRGKEKGKIMRSRAKKRYCFFSMVAIV